MSDHPIVTVMLNSGNYKGRLGNKVSTMRFTGRYVDRSAYFEVELLDHPTLKTIRVRKDQIIQEDK